MSPALDALKEIERLATEEVSQPGTVDDRFRALRIIQAKAQAVIVRTDLAPDLLVSLDSLCAWLLHRFGPESPEGREAQARLHIVAKGATEWADRDEAAFEAWEERRREKISERNEY